jgi:hypothetical protein
MSQPMLRPLFGPATYEICLIGREGTSTLIYETMCQDDDEAIGKLNAIHTIFYVRFEISCGDKIISHGARFS